jgi:ABC-type glycerol-3-phosphate transport system substrate-binding protein
MYRYFDIDDLGNGSVMRGAELDEFESFSPEWKEYQKRWKELADGGMSKKDAKKQAQEELGFKPGAKLFEKALGLFADKAQDPAVEGGSNNDNGGTTPPPPPPPPSTAGVGGGFGGSIAIAGMQVPTIALLGVAGVAAWYFMKKR